MARAENTNLAGISTQNPNYIRADLLPVRKLGQILRHTSLLTPVLSVSPEISSSDGSVPGSGEDGSWLHILISGRFW